MTLKNIAKMPTKSQLSQELTESIINVLGKNVKILYKSLIRMESRGDKVDNRVLVITSYRIYITTTKIPTRVDNGFHLMEIEALESKKANHVSITLIHEHKPVSILIGESTVPSTTSMWHKKAFDLRAEVAWDIDTIYLAHDIRLLHLKDFDHLDQRDLIPLLIALQHNMWFAGVCGDGVRAGSEAWEALCRVVRCAAPSPRHLSWRAAALRPEHAARLGHALARAHTPPAMDTIDLVLTGLGNNPNGLRQIALSQCGITGKTVTHLAAMLNDNPAHLNTLTHLDLSHNNLKDDVQNLYNFLAQPNVLTHLNLVNTETTLENMWGALLRGCAARLSVLQVGRNPWGVGRRPRDPPPSFRQFFTSCLALTDLDFSYCMEFELSGIVRAVGKNHSITHLSLSKLTGKRSYAPPLIQALVHVLQEPDTALTSLDLSDCKLKRCAEVFAAMGGAGAGLGVASEPVSLQAVRDALAPSGTTLHELINEAVESLALAACESVESADSERLSSGDTDVPDLLAPVSRNTATPLGCRRRERGARRVRPKSVAEQQCSSNEMLSLPPLHAEAADALAELPAHTLRHLVKGRPRRVKTRAPTRPITDQSLDIDEGVLYSVTSGESTPVLLDCEVSRCKSSDDVGTKAAPSTPPPSRSSDNRRAMLESQERIDEACDVIIQQGCNPASRRYAVTLSVLRAHPCAT
ncbi:unnamed protein product [Leptidea sinapis]|uniref:CARMIL pleckstrin homology domain-containing protein n=1 Tax=Leptidea sinapis TaxID=189913 RepID=A0A5E4Q0R8_9NEOP|nr:unnamed protein product [Leptidea sinapis]